jgi:hypothetical protein
MRHTVKGTGLPLSLPTMEGNSARRDQADGEILQTAAIKEERRMEIERVESGLTEPPQAPSWLTGRPANGILRGNHDPGLA